MLDNLESLARSFINNKNRELVLLENCYGSTTTNNIFYYPDFIAIDFETANRNRNSACSLALIVVEENQIVNKKHWYINPPTDDFYFSYLHGITKSTVLNAPTLAELWETELKFYIENKIIVAHNASFDISVLQTSLSEAGITQSKIQYLDTVEYARNFFPTLENHKLPTVCKFLGISLNHHNALSDAEACAQIVIKLNSQEYTTNSSENLAKIYQTTEEGTHLYKKIKDEIEFSHSTNIKDYYYFLYILQKCLVDTEKTITDSFAAKIFRSTGDIYLRLCHNKQLINSHFYRGVSELPYKLLFAVIYTHLEFRYEMSHTITSHHVHHFHQTRIPDGTLLDYMVQYRKPLFPQFFLYPKKFLPENNPHHKEFHLRPYIQNNANQ